MDLTNNPTTANNIEGCRLAKNLGVVCGITVRSRSVIGNMAGSIQAMGYDANDVMDGITEVLAYGTLVIVEKM
jgi:uncharacterized protein YbjQ (UPF0145 family)